MSIKTKKIYPDKLPFDDKGNFVNYAYNENIYTHIKYEWKDNVPFYAEMTSDSISRGRSSANFIFVDQNRRRYTVFMKDTLWLLQNLSSLIIVDGVIKGMWVGCKRGDNYGIKYYSEAE